MILYLDDWRYPPDGEDVVAATNYIDFIALIDRYRECLDTIDLDYDLGYDSMYNGYHVLLYMKKYNISCSHINIHSTHPIGKELMLQYATANFPGSTVTIWS